MQRRSKPVFGWGGARAGAGRPPNGARAGVSHLKRASHARAHPVHVTLQVRAGLPSLRGPRAFRAVREAVLAGKDRPSGRIVHFAVQSNRVHLLVEAPSGRALARAVQGLSIRIARALNRALGRAGKVFGDRYHARELGTPLEVRQALAYVLCNHEREARERGTGPLVGVMDACSSAAWFDGWELPEAARRSLEAFRAESEADRPVAEPRTWLLRAGYHRHGLVDPNDRREAKRGSEGPDAPDAVLTP